MFTKCALAKYEWEGQPDDIPETFIEQLILQSNSYNFCVCNFPRQEGNEAAEGEFWGYFSVLEREPKYGKPKTISVTNYAGTTISTSDFVLFNNFKNITTLPIKYISYYSMLIAQINKALHQHIYASQLIATIYAAGKTEADEIRKIFKDFDGIKVIKSDTSLIDGDKKANIVQFELTPRTEELEKLKQELQKDLFLRLGINFGTDKTHVTNANIEDSEEPRDLINSYELKLRKDFCKRYNTWKKNANLRVKIHTITAENSISEGGRSNDNGTVEAVSNDDV